MSLTQGRYAQNQHITFNQHYCVDVVHSVNSRFNIYSRLILFSQLPMVYTSTHSLKHTTCEVLHAMANTFCKHLLQVRGYT
jgi:hypothetical protein